MSMQRAAEVRPELTPWESAGCCGVIARLLGLGILAGVLAVIGVLLWTQPADRWQSAADPSAHPLALITNSQHPQTVYVATEQGHVLISQDGGAHWRAMTLGLPANTPISALALLPGGNSLMAGTSAGVYLSRDGGQTWRAVGPGIPSHVIVDTLSALPDGTLHVGTTSQGAYVLPACATRRQAVTGLPSQSDIYAFLPLARRGQALASLVSGGVYASQDDGVTWKESDRGISDASGENVFSFVPLPGAGGMDSTILAGTSRGVYASLDHGVSWTPHSAGIGVTRVISLARDPLTPMAPTDIFACADTGVYQSQDAGATWRPPGFGLPAEQQVGAIGVVHPDGGAQVVFASVDQLYRYPGQWPLATQLWRALALIAEVALAALTIEWARRILTR